MPASTTTEWNGFSEHEIQNIKKPIARRVLTTSKPRDKKVEKPETISEKINNNNDSGVEVKDDQISSEKTEIKNEIAENPIQEPDAKNKYFESLEDFEQYTKVIEQQNLERRKLLLNAITERAQKTKEEQLLLTNLRKQLTEIDKSLQADVSVLRNEIEDLSLTYLKAQQRYEKAEKEYITAKTEYHNISEKKQSLTENLFATIQHTEIKKAQKLSELLKLLDHDINNNNNPSTILVEKTENLTNGH